MLNLIIDTKDGEKKIDLSQGIYTIMQQLREYGVLADKPLCAMDLLKANAPVRLCSDSDFGNALIGLLDVNADIQDINLLVQTVQKVPDEFQDEIERNVLNEQYLNAEELYEDINNCKKSLATEKITFYCPLVGAVQDGNDGYCDVDGAYLSIYKDDIASAIYQYQTPDLEMAEYLCDQAKLGNKIVFAEWSVESLKDNNLYGRIDCYLAEKLSDNEIERLKEAIVGQNSDGLGESFEQQDIHIYGAEINVSFWHGGEDYFIRTQSEMDEYLSQQGNIKFGGE